MNNRRVAVVCTAFPLASETFIIFQIEVLIRLNYEVHIFPYFLKDDSQGLIGRLKLKNVVFPTSIPPVNYFYRILNAFIIFIKYFPDSLKLLKTLNFLRLGFGVFKLIEYYRAISFLKKPNYTVVIANFGENAVGIEKLIRCGFLNSKLVPWFRGYDLSSYGSLQNFEDDYRTVFQSAFKVVTVSKAFVNKLHDLHCPSDKINYIPSCPRDEFFTISPDYYNSNMFLFLGRLVEKKAPLILLKAFSLVIKKHPNAKLVIAGDGPLRENCVELISQLPDGSVRLLGAVAHKVVLSLMADSFCYVQHSIISDTGDSEGTPVAILEAASSGLPVVSTFHGGIPDVVLHGNTGFLVDEGDIVGMANFMCYLFSNRSLAMEMGRAGQLKVNKEFSSAVYAARMKKLLGETE